MLRIIPDTPYVHCYCIVLIAESKVPPPSILYKKEGVDILYVIESDDDYLTYASRLKPYEGSFFLWCIVGKHSYLIGKNDSGDTLVLAKIPSQMYDNRSRNKRIDVMRKRAQNYWNPTRIEIILDETTSNCKGTKRVVTPR